MIPMDKFHLGNTVRLGTVARVIDESADISPSMRVQHHFLVETKEIVDAERFLGD